MQAETIHMSDKSDQWQEEIVDLAKENSSKVLSMVLGITNGEAADRLLEVSKGNLESKFGFSPFLCIAMILETEVHTASLIQSYRTGISSYVQFADKFPTVNQWLVANPTRLAILRSGETFFYVGYGMVFSPKLVGQYHVTHVIFLDGEVGG